MKISSKIIGVSGQKENGKSTTCDILRDKYGYTLVSFGAAIKDTVAARYYGEDYHKYRRLLEGAPDDEESRKWREEPDKFWTKEMSNSASYLAVFPDGMVTPRRLLQYEGTDVTKVHIKVDFWISTVKKFLLAHPGEKIAFVDTRYPDEVEFIQSLGGQLLWVQRFDPEWIDCPLEDMKERFPLVHPSEYAWMKYQEEYIPLDNRSICEGWKEELVANLEKCF